MILSDAEKQKHTISVKTERQTALSEKSDVESGDGAVPYSDSELETEEKWSVVSACEKSGKVCTKQLVFAVGMHNN